MPEQTKCYAYRCMAAIERRYLMCGDCWKGVSMDTRREIHAAYVPGQISTGKWGLDFLKAANKARIEVARYKNNDEQFVSKLRKLNRFIEKLAARKEIGRLKAEFSRD